MHQNRRRQPGMGLMLLFYQLFGVIGIDKIPPVTLGCIGLQVAIFLRLFKLPWYNASEVCISAYNVYKKREYWRLLYGALEHGDDWHLYYNMFSFALKGQSLERRFGSPKFLYILSCFTLLTSSVLVTLNVFAGKYFGYSQHECAVGFSGVLFALKVLTTYYDNNYTQSIMGMPIIMPARYAVWVELVLIQVLVPNVSFFGHLAGVLVGMAYAMGPLGLIMDAGYSLINGSSRLFSPPWFTDESEGSSQSSSRPRFTPRTERSGYARESFNQYVPPGMTEEEQLRRAMDESMRGSANTVPPYPNSNTAGPPPPPGFFFGEHPSAPPAPGFAPNIEELRTKRTSHYTSY